MKTLLFVLFISGTALAEQNYCTPNAQFKMDCNWCTCSSDGKTAACTDMLCLDESNSAVEENVKFCEPGRVFKLDDFSTCKCIADGTKAMCTLGLGPLSRAKISNQYCTPGSLFSPDHCNTCHCSNDGTTALCTLMVCPEKKLTMKQVCQLGKQFKNYCNTCFCDSEGLSYSCTRMFCDEEIWNQDGTMKVDVKPKSIEEPKQVCEPLSTFKDYCNTCRCSKDGSSFMCTMMYCDKDIWNQDGTIKEEAKLQSELGTVCKAGRLFSPDGCNTCICNEYGTEFACTLKLCPTTFKRALKTKGIAKWGPVYEQGESCTPGTNFYSECNQCVCTQSGRSALCTLMKCPTAT